MTYEEARTFAGKWVARRGQYYGSYQWDGETKYSYGVQFQGHSFTENSTDLLADLLADWIVKHQFKGKEELARRP